MGALELVLRECVAEEEAEAAAGPDEDAVWCLGEFEFEFEFECLGVW